MNFFFFATLLAATSCLPACFNSSDATERANGCFCVDPSVVQLRIPADEVRTLASVGVSGPACGDQEVKTCSVDEGSPRSSVAYAIDSGRCDTFFFQAKSAGVCHIVVSFSDRAPFVTDLQFSGGKPDAPCCGGPRPDSQVDGGVLSIPESAFVERDASVRD
jgi:hypothetical protein